MQRHVPLPSEMATPTSQGCSVRPAPGGSPQVQAGGGVGGVMVVGQVLVVRQLGATGKAL